MKMVAAVTLRFYDTDILARWIGIPKPAPKSLKVQIDLLIIPHNIGIDQRQELLRAMPCKVQIDNPSQFMTGLFKSLFCINRTCTSFALNVLSGFQINITLPAHLAITCNTSTTVYAQVRNPETGGPGPEAWMENL